MGPRLFGEEVVPDVLIAEFVFGSGSISGGCPRTFRGRPERIGVARVDVPDLLRPEGLLVLGSSL
jgi:hypothetical protein